ncbi:conserved protein of unknown function [Rhodovastum atsumiense]|uniref:Uncharacterized protein n=1 Tax=Rhodovastum atsumiense TaxID=504468 RepID=A0A5M6IV10_9PROT|nr:DUF6525 family protein [Rhodovastum atsumiense]KAA5612136.1 hypothetical protein F1189_10740 [Rhodovastum atsumiense]CAH2603921.1 conserved protein of unknown function [Rhodovastum atsumiense]
MPAAPAGAENDGTLRAELWRRFNGDDWAAYDALPARLRRRLQQHAYDPWAVNAWMLWRRYRRLHPTAERAEQALIRYFDHCERLERAAFAAAYARDFGLRLPHDAAGATVLRDAGQGASHRTAT